MDSCYVKSLVSRRREECLSDALASARTIGSLYALADVDADSDQCFAIDQIQVNYYTAEVL